MKDCDHYWLVRRGGTCSGCGAVFPGGFAAPWLPWEENERADREARREARSKRAGELFNQLRAKVGEEDK